MSNKVSDCCGAEVRQNWANGKDTCTACQKPCGVKIEITEQVLANAKSPRVTIDKLSKPTPAPESRLLSDEEINEVTIWCNHPVEIPMAIAKAQDAKTSALVRAECQDRITNLEKQTKMLGQYGVELEAEIKQRDANYAQLQKWADCQLAEAKKQGAKELIEAEVSSLSVLSYQWAADATEWADKRRGKIVFISEAAIKEIGL